MENKAENEFQCLVASEINKYIYIYIYIYGERERERIRDSESSIWVVYGFEGGFWLDGFEGMWIGFCRGWVGGVWIGGEVRSLD